MCTGLEIAGLALAAAGTATSMTAAKQAQSRMEGTIQSQLAAQRGFQQQATPLFQRSLEESSPANVGRQISAGEQSAADLYTKLRSLPMGQSALPQDTQSQLRTEQTIKQQQGAQAGLQGYQASNLSQWLKDLETQNRLGVISNLSQSSAQTTPYMLSAAQNSTANLAGLGSLLGTGGSLLGMYGALGQYLKPQPKPTQSAPTGAFPWP